MSLFKQSVENAKQILESWTKVIAFLQGAQGMSGEKFNQEAEVPGTEQRLRWFDERVIAVCNLVKYLEKVKDEAGAPIPIGYIDQLEQASQQLKNTITEMVNIIEEAKEGKIASLDPGTWEVVVNATGANLNFASYLQNFKSYSEELLTAFYQVAPIVDADKFDAFTEAVREVSEKTESVRNNVDLVSKARENAEADAAATNMQKNQAEEYSSKVENLFRSAQEILEKIEEANQYSQSQLEKVSQISSEASSLKSEVEGYETQFHTFQQSLSDRNATFQKWSIDVESLYEGLKENKEKIDDKIQRAEEMLQGATNAGLAGTFNTTLSELDDKLKWSRRAFYFSIFFLFLSGIPLVLYTALATGIFNTQTVDPSTTAKGVWENLALYLNSDRVNFSITITFFLIMVPTVWLTKFSAARHHQLFQLREHYQYKYSLAMAVDGFKKQAPEHADAIAAETFNRLLINPVDRLEGKGASDDIPSPLMNWLMNKFGFNAKGEQKGGED